MGTSWSSEIETDRLIRQSDFYGPFTWRLLRAAELTGGMPILAVGRGAAVSAYAVGA